MDSFERNGNKFCIYVNEVSAIDSTSIAADSFHIVSLFGYLHFLHAL